MLKSREMHLSGAERGWLPWSGKTGSLAMRWATWLNKRRYPGLENAFSGFAATRVKILQSWAAQQWTQLDSLAARIAPDASAVSRELLEENKVFSGDFSELFVISTTGCVLQSTSAARVGSADLPSRAVSAALRAPFLHGPYIDPVTAALPPSSSKFHDAVTLMFYQPVFRGGACVAILCARVPNDVLGDLIQREAGHVFHESGDNYLFMVKAAFDPAIAPGTALSRSRFEDSTFSLGDNLKQGVRTDYGVVRVQRHTELELVFNDPATGRLHPGVRETIAKGENLFVTYPGYSDYRHIPVIGKGVTFTLPGSPDQWGMMCEADLEEVYRYRSVSYKMQMAYMLNMLFAWGCATLVGALLEAPAMLAAALQLATLAVSAWSFHALVAKPLSTRLMSLNRTLNSLAEGGGNLSQRLPRSESRGDETTVMAQWINSFIDNLEQIIHGVIKTSRGIDTTNAALRQHSDETRDASRRMVNDMGIALNSIRKQVAEIDGAGTEVEAMRGAVQASTEASREQFELVKSRSDSIRQSVGLATQTIRDLEASAQEIGRIVVVIDDIAKQTNLLALNAAIEAARAGTEGRGFAVVADEVRKLAERTAKSTREITTMVGAVQSRAEEAVITMDTGMSDLEEGLQLATDAATDKKEVQDILQRLFSTIDQLAAASHDNGARVEGIARSADAVRHAVTEASESAVQTSNAAKALDQLVGQFTVSHARG